MKCRSLRLLVLALLFVSVLRAGSALAQEESPAVGDSLRGTSRPLQRDTNPLQWSGRVLLAPPYWTWRVVSWPVKRGTRLYETSEVFRTVADVAVAGAQWGPVRVQGFANWGSGQGFTEAGLKTTSSGWPSHDWSLLTKTGYIDNNRNVLELRLTTPQEERVCVHFRSLYESKADRRFHGLGAESPDTELFFDRRSYLFETWLDISLGSTFSVDLSGFYDRSDLDDVDADEVAEGESFAAALPGLFAQTEETEYTGVGLRMSRDTRDRGAYSSTGSVLELEAGWNESLFDADSDYAHFGGTWQQFLQLGRRPRRVLGLRLFARGIEADDASRVPVIELERAGGRFGLRGYPDQRFAGLCQFVATAEYRYRLTVRIRGAVFADWGNVASKWGDLLEDPIDPSFGFGLIVGRSAPVAAYVAASREGVQFSFGSENIFSLRSRRLR